MSVSVIVIASGGPKKETSITNKFDSKETLGACVESLAKQTVCPREVIVVDGSRDGSATSKLFIGGLDMWKVVPDPSGIQSHSRNIGVGLSNGSVVAFLDSDCVAPPGWIGAVEENAKKGIEAMGGPYIPFQQTDFAQTTYRLMGWSTSRLTMQFARREDQRKVGVDSVTGGNSAFARDLFLRARGYNEKQDCREESDFCRRVRERDVEILFDPEMWVYHRWRGWDGLKEFAQTSYFYGRIRVRSPRQAKA